MTELHLQEVKALDQQAVGLSEAECLRLCSELTNWQLVAEESVQMLRKAYKFDTYIECLEFTQAVAELAEEFDHHPRIVVEWGSVEVSWWTHVVKGLHLNDFILASKTDLCSE